MKGRILGNIFIVIIFIFASFASTLAEPAPISDTDIVEETTDSSEELIPDVIITEIQTSGPESGTSNHEFIEFYNNSDNIVDLTDWQLIYINSSGSESLLYEFVEPLLFLPETFIMGKLVGAPLDFMTEEQFEFEYVKGTTGIAASEGGLRLLDSNAELIDEVLWTSAGSSADDIILSLVGGLSAQRYILDGELVEDELLAKRFIIEEPSPKSYYETETPHPDIDDETEEEVVNEIIEVTPKPVNNPAIYLNELLPDPASPQKDSEHEFIELYNPNSTNLDISGYRIVAKTTSQYSYELPSGTNIPAKGYYYVTSAISPIALSNSGATVSLIDNLGKQIDSTAYVDSDSGNSWAKAGGKWQWSISPTPGKGNIITSPVIIAKTTKVKASSTSSKKASSSAKTNFANNPSIKINEIFPDPKSPLKDSQDEFIELYNPNNRRLNIADYVITSGATRTYKHTLPAGASIEAKGYYTVTSADTSLALTNSGGTVTLTDNLGVKIDSIEYAGVISGQSWALIDGKWQWTATPTINTSNKLSSVPSGTGSDSSYTNTEVAGATVAGSDDTPLVLAPQPLPGWLLAAIGVAAICYAAYEYRFEARNYYYKYQRVRSPR